MTTLRASSTLKALYKRELRRYFSSVLYVLNTGIGMVLALIMSVALLFFKPAQLELVLEIPGFASAIGALTPMVLTIMVSMSNTTCCSVSLEGKSLWIMKSLPVKAIRIFNAKLLVNLTVTIPAALLCALILALALPMNAVQIPFMFLTPAAFAVLSAIVGLFLNLLYPNFTWTSETAVIKQGMPMFFSVIGGMMVTIGLLVGLAFLPASLQTIGLAVLTIAVAVLDFVLYRLLQTKGERLFDAL
jgi:ABC-2 type transport system permease protein